MTASKKQQLTYRPSEHVVHRLGLWRVVKAVRGYNLQNFYAGRWTNKAFKADRDEALKLLATKRVR